MKRVAALVAVLALIGVGVWLVWPSSSEVRGQEQRIGVVDGPNDDQAVQLDTTFFPPAGGGKAPAVLLAHGFGSSKNSVRDQAVRLAQDGYAVLTWSARGFGRSTGQIALNSPDYEVKDVKQLINWLSERPEVLLDAKGDPRVGIAGGSYGGAIALMTAANDPRVDAIVPQITWYDLADALFPNATGQGPETGVFKRMWAGLFFSRGNQGGGGLQALVQQQQPQQPQSAEEARCGRFLPEVCAMYQEVAATGKATPEAVALLRKSSPVSVQGRIKVPTLLVQGQRDSLFPLGHADANAKAIAATGAPVDVVWFDGGHDGGNGEIDYLYDHTSAWFARYLKKENGAATAQAFTVTRDGGRDPGTRQRIRLHPEAGAYPGLGGTTTTEVKLDGPAQNVASPPGGSPASISSVPGIGGLLGGNSQSNLSISLDQPGQGASFESPPLTAPLQLTGTPTAKIRVHGKGEVTLFAKLYDVGDSAQPPNLPNGLVAPVKVTVPEGAASVDATVTLPAVDHLFPAGHRLRLTVTTTDMGYAMPAQPATYQIELAAPALAVPTVAALTAPAAGLAWWVWAMPLAAIAVAAGLLATGRRRQADEPELDGVPLEIRELTKSYRNGEKAVDDLSFRVEHGQVLGLLGPNGAGKTTTMRMMMGLIIPDGGEIRIFGERVTPGAPVLSRLGSFVEGPGFLPHLSGRDNLELYWAATGRPTDEAHFEEALEIAGLGAAIERAVRTYSQGMRQRLAIAQAMLGLPDLLVLDEPTNGLDPPQIREMRQVLKRYADNGRTVIVSSHMLAEVEQTCSHVVVMHRGRLISAGPVATLLASSNGHGPRLEDVFLDLIGEKS